MQTRKTTKRILGLLLCAVLLLGIASPVADADELSTAVATPELSTATSAEVVSLREENIKHFNMGDGIYQAIVYSHPVHELDDSGKWKDIDFSLSLTGTRGNQKYTIKAAGVTFAEKYEAGKSIVSVSKNNKSVTLTLLSANKVSQKDTSVTVAAAVKNPKSEIRSIEEANAFCDGCAANLAALMREEGLIP